MKPSEEVRVGAVIAFPRAGTVCVVRVRSLPARRGPPAEARAHLETLAPANVAQEGAGD